MESLKIVRALRRLLLALLLMPASLAAQAPSVAERSRQLAGAEVELAAVDRALDGRVDQEARRALRARAVAAGDAATEAAGDLARALALIDARAAQLGPAAAGEAPDLKRQRAELTRERASLDSSVKRGRLVAVEAQQLADEIQQTEAEQFGRRISEQVPSPLSPAFWRGVLQAMPRDLRRIEGFLGSGAREAARQGRQGTPWPALLGLIAALLIVFPGRLRARALGQRVLIEGAPGRRVRRSGYALWRVLVGTLAPLLAAAALVQGLRWTAPLPAGWSDLLGAVVGAIGFGGFAAAVTGALLLRNQPSWRLIPIDDAMAARLRPFSLALAVLAATTIVLDAFNAAVGASPAALAAWDAVEVLLHLLLIGGALVGVARLRARRADDGAEEGAATRAGLGAVVLLLWIAVAAALVALCLGRIGFSLFVVQLVTWTVVLGSATYILTVAVDDVATATVERSSPLGRALVRGVGMRGSAVDQAGVLLSAALRVGIALAALGLLFVPFGTGDGIVATFGRLGVLAQGVQLGGVTISPGAILRAVVVLFVGLALVRGFMRWLEGRYLPATDLDGSGRNSVSLVARYVGIALATIWALASLGIGVERIALLLSALSVGIGFGLQAITSNFVSGLILLAERPIKIGDLVRIGTDEGDVKRISVRSTEIELPDHSTLIVPNSELITKTVLNKTLANPLGRIQIQFSIPIEADADVARGIVLAAFAAEEAVIADPAPSVFVDSIVNGRTLFNCFAHVGSPRAAYGARSGVLLTLLRRFREAGIEIGTPPQRLELVPPHQPPAPPPNTP